MHDDFPPATNANLPELDPKDERLLSQATELGVLRGRCYEQERHLDRLMRDNDQKANWIKELEQSKDDSQERLEEWRERAYAAENRERDLKLKAKKGRK